MNGTLSPALLAATVALICATVVLFGCYRAAQRFHWFDLPDTRKAHVVPTPAIGGISWFLGLAAGIGFANWAWPVQAHWNAGFLLAGCTLLMLMGVLDDRRPLPSGPRLLVQVIAVLISFQAVGPLQSLGNLLGERPLDLGYLAWPVTIFMATGVINAMNMIDGMDGLLAGVLGLSLLALGLFFGVAEAKHLLVMACALTALLPFALVNVRSPWLARAKVFFGDCGSMPAGLLLAHLLISGANAGRFAPVTALWLFALPLTDTVSLMLRRTVAGRSPLSPDQNHLHHVLQRAGLSVKQTLATLLAGVLCLQLLGLALQKLAVAHAMQALLFLIMAFSYHFWMARSLTRGELAGRALRANVSAVPPLSDLSAGKPSDA